MLSCSLVLQYLNKEPHTSAKSECKSASCDPYRFVLIEEPKTWAEAQSYCREKYTDLVTVQSDADRAKLKEAVDAVSFTSVAWIGFYKVFWLWSHQNTVISYAKWGNQEPNLLKTHEACATVSEYEQWSDTSCTELKYFFCQTGKKLYSTFVQLCSGCSVIIFDLSFITCILTRLIHTAKSDVLPLTLFSGTNI
uniref:C-type lectin domain-containing protein n=1 Tax=Sinocyclocheilus grahami TaxID=75366 RepID=A0A672PA51_SINGR